MREADFSEHIKRILCERVGGRCSNPNCGRETLGPHADGDKRLSIGEAAHISAASPEGPRYDARLTKEERESINNGIWLCSNCHKLIDKNPTEYSAEELRKWKIIAEYEQEKRQRGVESGTFYDQQAERKRKALRTVKVATDSLHSVLEDAYTYWVLNFSRLSSAIDLQNEIDNHYSLYENELQQTNCYLEKRDLLCGIISKYSLDIGRETMQLLKEYIQLLSFKYYDDGIGMANNYWSSFFDMLVKNIESLRKIKAQIDDRLYFMYVG